MLLPHSQPLLITVVSAGLQFEPILGMAPRLRSSRYGAQATPPIAYPVNSVSQPWQQRAYALNVFLLDDRLPDGRPSGYRQHASSYPAKPGACLGKQEPVTLVVREAYSARVNQLFEDGNHRTAIASI